MKLYRLTSLSYRPHHRPLLLLHPRRRRLEAVPLQRATFTTPDARPSTLEVTDTPPRLCQQLGALPRRAAALLHQRPRGALVWEQEVRCELPSCHQDSLTLFLTSRTHLPELSYRQRRLGYHPRVRGARSRLKARVSHHPCWSFRHHLLHLVGRRPVGNL